MGFGEGDHRAGLEGDDGDVHVVAQVGRIDEAVVAHLPSVPAIGVGVTAVSLMKMGSGRFQAPGTAS